MICEMKRFQYQNSEIRRDEIRRIKTLPLIPEWWGAEPGRITAGKAWYYAPWRNEKTPSLCIYIDKNDWVDFDEAGAGGSIIDLAQKYFDLDYPKAMFMLRKMLARYEY